jgi:hypothetical protein
MALGGRQSVTPSGRPDGLQTVYPETHDPLDGVVVVVVVVVVGGGGVVVVVGGGVGDLHWFGQFISALARYSDRAPRSQKRENQPHCPSQLCSSAR